MKLFVRLLFGVGALASAAPLVITPSFAQTVSEVVVFGDSNVDSGNFRQYANLSAFGTHWPAAVAAGAGAPVSRPGLGNAEHIANYYGLDLLPSYLPGGTNYATSGAKDAITNTAATGGFGVAVPTVTQISTFLAARGNVASPNALFIVHSGDNDADYAAGGTGTGPYPADPTAFMNTQAVALANAIKSIHTAGGRQFLVRSLNASFPQGAAALNVAKRAAKAAHNTKLYSELALLGVTVIRSDFDDVRLALLASPSAFGFTTVSNADASQACTIPAGVTNGAHALLCSSAAGAPSTFVNATADMTRLFADEGHLATHGQKIRANHDYALLPPATSSPLVAAILPSSRSVQVGAPATVFAVIINSGSTALSGCRISPVSNVNGRFFYQTASPANALTGTANTPVSIPAGGAQNFVIGFTPTTAAQASGDVRFAYVCAGAPSALPLTTVNTVRLSIDANPVADMITTGVTPSADGYARISGPTGLGVFVVATVNIGAAATLTARVRLLDTGMPLTATVCQTNPATAVCLSPATTTVTTSFANNAVSTWNAYLQASGDIPIDPANKRILFEFVDAGGVVRGSNSVAVTTVAADGAAQLAAK